GRPRGGDRPLLDNGPALWAPVGRRNGTATLSDAAGALHDRRQVEGPVVVPARLAVGGRREADPARPRQSARHEVDGSVRAGSRHSRDAVRRIDRLLRLARVHPDAHSGGGVALQPGERRDGGLHHPDLMARKLWLGGEALAVALVVSLLALLVWRVMNDNKEGVAQALDKGKHPTAPAFDLQRLNGAGSVDLASLRGR